MGNPPFDLTAAERAKGIVEGAADQSRPATQAAPSPPHSYADTVDFTKAEFRRTPPRSRRRRAPAEKPASNGSEAKRAEPARSGSGFQYLGRLIVAPLVMMGLAALLAAIPRGDKRPSPSVYDPASPRWDMTETTPDRGGKSVLSVTELRYCEFARARLDHKRVKAVGDSVQNQFDAVSDDLHARCDDRLYRQEDMDTVTSQIPREREIIAGADAIAAAVALSGAAPMSLMTPPVPAAPALDQSAPIARPKPAQSADPALHYRLDTITGAMEVQGELMARDFYQGRVDGHWGPASKAALLAWKVSVGMAPDAVWDAATESVLMGR
jgi:hypothetical protein